MKKFVAAGIIALITIVGCSKTDEEEPQPQPVLNSIISINTLSETFSQYIPDSDKVIEDAGLLGDSPNRALIMDGIMYVVNSGYQGVPSFLKINLSTGDRDSLLLPSNSNPYDLTYMDGYFYITAFNSSKVYKIDANLQLKDSIEVGTAPEGIIAQKPYIYVACTGYNASGEYNSEIDQLIDTGRLEFVKSFKIGVNIQELAIYNDYLYALQTGNYSDVGGKIYKLRIPELEVEDEADIEGSPGRIGVYDNFLWTTGFSSNLCKIEPSSLNYLCMDLHGSAITGMEGYGLFVSKFDSQGPNYLYLVNPDSLTLIDSVNLGNSKGVVDLVVWK